MKAVIPDPVSLRPDHAVYRRDRSRRSLEGRAGGPGPILPRAVTTPGNVSMYDHLQAIRQQAEAELDVAIIWPGGD